MKKYFILIFASFLLISCNNQKIGIDDLPNETKETTNKIDNIINNDDLSSKNADLNTGNLIDEEKITYTNDLINPDAKPSKEEQRQKVIKYIKNNFRSINPTNNNYDSIVDFSFDNNNNVEVEYIENENHYKLHLKYIVYEKAPIEIIRLGYFKKQDNNWIKLTSIPTQDKFKNDNISKNQVNTGKNVLDNLSGTSTNISDKERIQNMINKKDTGSTLINVKGYDSLNISSLKLNILYPKYWYWRWFSFKGASAAIGFSKNQMNTISDATIVFFIKSIKSDIDTSSYDLILTRKKDEKTMYVIAGPLNMKEIMQQMLDSVSQD